MKKTLAIIFLASMLTVSLGGVVSAANSAAHDAALLLVTNAIAAGDPPAVIANLQAQADALTGSTGEPLPFGFDALPTLATTGGQAVVLITALTNWLFVILSVAAVIFIVLAGLEFITGGGDPEKIASARMKLMYAAVGIAVALLARAVPFVIQSIIS